MLVGMYSLHCSREMPYHKLNSITVVPLNFFYSDELYSQLLHCISEFCDALCDRVITYHVELCLTTLLHDAASHDWKNEKPFYEVFYLDNKQSIFQ